MKYKVGLLLSCVMFFQIRTIFMDCVPPMGEILCTCSDNTLSCTGIQTENIDLMSVIVNASSIYFPSIKLENVVVSIENLVLNSSSTFEEAELKKLSLSSGLTALEKDIFVGTSFISLSLRNNSFDSVPSEALLVLHVCEHLDLSHNVISSIFKNDFNGLENLKILYLSHNMIEKIDGESFSPLTNLEQLHLDFNHLRELGITVFDNLHKLKFLNLTFNQLQAFEPETFTELSSLHELILDHNNFSSLDNLHFSSESLIKLSVVNCSLKGLVKSSNLQNLPNLVSLDLSYNYLTLFEEFALTSVRHLKFLNASHNVIRELKDNAFSHLYSLEELNLRNNVLFVIRMKAFYNLTNLQSLNLANNKLGAFLCEYTSDLLALKTIDLSQNQLKTIRAGTFMYSHQLKDIRMQGNILDCTCLISDFAEYLHNSTTLDKGDVTSITCASPASLLGKAVLDVDFDSMKCPVPRVCSSPVLSAMEDEDYEDESEISISTTETSMISSTSEISTSTFLISETVTSAPETSTVSSSTETLTVASSTETSTVSLTSETSTSLSSASPNLTLPSSESPTADSSTSEATLLTSTSSEATILNSSTSETASSETTEGIFKIFSTNDSTTDMSSVSTTVSTTLITASISSDISTTAVDTTTMFASTQLSGKTKDEMEIIIMNHTYSSGLLCVDWILNGSLPGGRIQCILHYSYPNPSVPIHHESHQKRRFGCPATSNIVSRDCLSIFNTSMLTQFCIQIYKQSTRSLLISYCVVSKEKLTTESLTPIVSESTTGTIFSTISSTEVTSSTIVYSSPTNAFNTTLSYGHEMSTVTDLNFLERTSKPLKPFNFTYVNLAFVNETSVQVDWKVNRKEPFFACQLQLKISTTNFNHTNLQFQCADSSVVVSGLKEDDTDYKVCITANHSTYGVIPVCHHIFNPSQRFSAATTSSKSPFLTLPVIALFCLLVIIILIVSVLAMRSILRKPGATDRYNVSEEEQKVQRRESRNRSSSHSVRYSYTVNENFDTF